jgi:hypothetical protein
MSDTTAPPGAPELPPSASIFRLISAEEPLPDLVRMSELRHDDEEAEEPITRETMDDYGRMLPGQDAQGDVGAVSHTGADGL